MRYIVLLVGVYVLSAISLALLRDRLKGISVKRVSNTVIVGLNNYDIDMNALEEIMSLVKEEDLELIAKNYGVNRYNNKLTGELIFKGLMRLILLGNKTSLRMLATLINQSAVFYGNQVEASYSGISKRLKVIKWEYFEGIYKDLLNKLAPQIPIQEGKQLHRFDSTIINLSGYLIKDGLKIGGKANDSQIKVSIGLKNALPSSVRFYES